jgi:SAM-dependent methyltransferase
MADLRQLSKLPTAVKRDGISGAAKIIKRSYSYKIGNQIARANTKLNSERYWNIRLKYNWDQSGGDVQTRQFAVAMINYVNPRILMDVSSVLDYGCGTGESCPILKTAFPDAKIYVYDVAQNGVKKALQKFSHNLSVEAWDDTSTCDFVYSSNVIEHVLNPREFLENLIKISNNYILVQCPWLEYGEGERKITPEQPQSEHFWTIDDDFLDEHFNQADINWKKIVGKVPIAWEGGEQLFMLGKKKKSNSET